MNWNALATSLRLASLTTVLLLAFGAPLAWWLSASTRRWKFLVEAVVALPLVLPPTVLGFYLLVALGPRAPLGKAWQALTGHPLVFTFEGLVVGSVLYSLPFAVQPMAAAFAAVPVRLIEASRTLGVSRLGTFRRIVIPHARDGMVTAAVLSFVHTLGEFGVVLMVGGNIEGETRTLSIDIYDRVQALDFAGAARTSLALVTFSFVVLAAIYALHRRARPGWPAVWRQAGRAP